jgi:hypothetical protein
MEAAQAIQSHAFCHLRTRLSCHWPWTTLSDERMALVIVLLPVYGTTLPIEHEHRIRRRSLAPQRRRRRPGPAVPAAVPYCIGAAAAAPQCHRRRAGGTNCSTVRQPECSPDETESVPCHCHWQSGSASDSAVGTDSSRATSFRQLSCAAWIGREASDHIRNDSTSLNEAHAFSCHWHGSGERRSN